MIDSIKIVVYTSTPFHSQKTQLVILKGQSVISISQDTDTISVCQTCL